METSFLGISDFLEISTEDRMEGSRKFFVSGIVDLAHFILEIMDFHRLVHTLYSLQPKYQFPYRNFHPLIVQQACTIELQHSQSNPTPFILTALRNQSHKFLVYGLYLQEDFMV